MAATSSRAHLVRELSHSRRSTSSPQDYATATSSSFGRDAIHSTAQMPDMTTQQQLPQQPLQYDQFPDGISEGGSEGSGEMSIELGRGVKRLARDRDDDISQRALFNMGNDSLYEVTATPPIRARNSSRKTDEGLRRQASIRRAAETAKTSEGTGRIANNKNRSLSEALRNITTEEDTSFMAEGVVQHTATFNARNTRFARSRQTSAAAMASAPPQQQTPRRATAPANNASASFVLPDLPNITELVSGVRKDGTPLFTRTTKPQSRSRFTSSTFKAAQHYSIQGIPLPEEEKAIYASLQLLKDRVDQLEMEKSEAAKRAEEYEGEIIDLRSKLATTEGRPDSGLGSSAGSEEEDPQAVRSGRDKTSKLQARVKALQEHLDRSERKVSVTEIAVKRVTKERDEVVKQIGVAYYNIEELKLENEGLQEGQQRLSEENEELKAEVDALRAENQDLRVLVQQTQASYEAEVRRISTRHAMNAARGASEAAPEVVGQQQDNARAKNSRTTASLAEAMESRRPHSTRISDEAGSDDLAIRIAQEVQKNRQAAAGNSKVQEQRTTRDNKPTATRNRSRSKSQSHRLQPTAGKRIAPASEAEASDAESTTQLDFNSAHNKPQATTSKRASLPTPARSTTAAQGQVREEDSRDLTLLSWLDVKEVHKLRKKLEEERRAGRLNGQRAASAPDTQQSVLGARKSSLKDLTTAAGSEHGATGRFNFDDLQRKSVRVQSPHTSDESIHPSHQPVQPSQVETEDLSILSNTSRRRRRAVSAEGMTSAFILPDITLHATINKSSTMTPKHNAENCTACPPTQGKKQEDVTIPTPIPVTDRPEDVADITNATIRPSQPPPRALAQVIKQLNDEVTHLKLQFGAQTRLYSQHDPALSKRRRMDVSAQMDKLKAEIQRRSDQLYALFDVLEGQKQAASASAASGEQAPGFDEQAVDETLESLGIDPVEMSGAIGRNVTAGNGNGLFQYDGEEDVSEELPWKGLSEVDSEENAERRRSREF